MFYQKCDLNRNSFNCGAKFEEENCAKWENIRMAVLHHHSYSLAFVKTNYLCGCCTQDPLCILQDLSLQRMDSLVIVHRLSCSVAFGILIPWPGIEPVSPALQGGFLTIGLAGNSLGLLSCYTELSTWDRALQSLKYLFSGPLQKNLPTLALPVWSHKIPYIMMT